MSNIGYRVFENIKRPDLKIINGFAGIQVANIDDCMNRIGAINESIQPMNGKVY